MEWEFFFGVAALVDLPLLAGDAEAADRRAPKLEPETALVQHQGGVLVVTVFWGTGLQLLLDQLFLGLLLGRSLQGESLLERGGCPSELLGRFGDVVVVTVVKLYKLVKWFSLLLAAQLFLVKQRLNLAKTRSVGFLKSQQESNQLCEIRRIHLFQNLQVVSNQLLAIDLQSLRVEPRNFLHQRELSQHQTSAKHIRFIDIMLCKPGIPVDHMGFPQDRREILRGASDGGHSKGLLLFIVRIIKVILALAEVDDLSLVVTQKEQISWLDIPMTDPLALQERTGRDETAVHPHQL